MYNKCIYVMYISSECHSIDCITKCIRKSRKESIHKKYNEKKYDQHLQTY